MLDFFNKENINKSKKSLSNEFKSAIDTKIFLKSEERNLMISSYNIHYFLGPLKTQNSISQKGIMPSLKNIVSFIHKTNTDILLLQEALFNDKIIAFFRQNNLTPYVCDTYEISNKNSLYYYGNIILIHNKNSNIKITTVSKTISLSGYHQRKKCIVNLIVDYIGYSISIYNVHLDVWDRTGKCRLEQIKNILKLIKNDPTPNIILGGDFNAIKGSDYDSSQSEALKKFYSTYTSDPFKEIEYLEKQKFINVTDKFKNKITSTVWSKQRVDFFFVRQGFSIPISNYFVHHIKGSDHYPISIELLTSQNCINLQILNKPIISNQENILLRNGKRFVSDKKLLYKNSINNCPVVIKILPIWNKKWEQTKNILHNVGLSNSVIEYGKNSAFNEYTITKYMSKFVENNVSFCFMKTIAAYETESIPIKQDAIKKFHLLDIPNQKFYLLIQPLFHHCEQNQLFKKYTDLVVFQLQWSLFISFKRFNFVHGDIYHGTKNNVFCNVLNLFGKKYTIIKYKNLIWKFPIDGQLPYIIMFDFEFSDFSYKNIQINNKIPTLSIQQYPIGNTSTIEKKRELDITGLNIALKKIGINKKIPQVSTYYNKDLLNGFEKYRITEEQFSKLDKNIYFLFDGTSKKL